ncbi:MAG TPA: sigma factor-like helix-turn-helix DNA-binding protein [Anaerolineae bacterium]|nr:sigma factor-like helix-turn-helix DNA-binding protein [Anaerolineae bacterium]HPL29615.1 sigma factor-like helix-turn-helix DNA-binding protein [Anaerolineae bacterium]
MDEHALIAAACRGDAESLGRLAERYQDAAYNVAYRLLGCTGLATEALEEALLAALSDARQHICVHSESTVVPGMAGPTAGVSRGAMRGESFGTWLLRRVVAACRRRARLRRCPPASPGRLEDPGGASLGPGLVQAIEAGLAALPLESRLVLVLADVQGLSYEEIAQVAGVAPRAVARRRATARARLRDWMDASGHGTFGPERASSTWSASRRRPNARP